MIGLYSFRSPASAAHIYGISIPAASQKAPTSISKDEAYVYAHGSRNLAIGTSILGLTAFWQFSSICRLSHVTAQAVQRCVGITILAGSMVPVTDAYFISQYVERSGVSAQDSAHGKKASKAHAMRSVLWIAVGVSCLLS